MQTAELLLQLFVRRGGHETLVAAIGLPSRVNTQLLFNGEVYQTRPFRRSAVLEENFNYFNKLLDDREFEGAALMKRQISQKRQVDAGCAGEVIVNRVRMLIGPVGKLEQ